MDWYYAQGGQQKGPVTDVELAGLVANNIVTDQTLVWHAGLANWRPYGEVKTRAATATDLVPPVVQTQDAPQPEAGQIVCAECGRIYPQDQAVAFGAAWVCAGCKPVYVQRLREGVAPSGRRGRRALPVDPEQLVAEVLQRGVEVNIGACVGRAWELVKTNLGLTIGTTLLVMICMQAPGIIPFLGACIGLVLNGPLMGGLYVFFLKLIRGERPAVGDAFAGFKRFGSLLGVFLLMCVLIYLPLIPCLAYVIATGQFDRQAPDALSIVLGAVGFLFTIYLAMAYFLAIPLVADLELGTWSALEVSRRVVARKWFSFFALGLVGGCIMLLGVLALCVGVLVAMPLVYAAWMYAYEDIFGERPVNS